MAHLDRLVWADGVALRAYGLRLGVRVSTADRLPEVLARIPAYRVSRSALVDVMFSLQDNACWTDHRLGARAGTFDLLLEAFEAALHRHLIADARGYQFVHAGCVGWRGRAIVVPGHSRAGKSTLVQALVRAGATYYSDEFAVVDRRGRVHAFPTLLRLRRDDGTSERVAVPPGRRQEPLPLGLVVRTWFEPGATWQPRRLASGESMLALMPHAGRANSAPAAVMAALARAIATAGGVESPRGEADLAAAGILAQADRGDGARRTTQDG
jgi:hypothetical protein